MQKMNYCSRTTEYEDTLLYMQPFNLICKIVTPVLQPSRRAQRPLWQQTRGFRGCWNHTLNHLGDDTKTTRAPSAFRLTVHNVPVLSRLSVKVGGFTNCSSGHSLAVQRACNGKFNYSPSLATIRSNFSHTQIDRKAIWTRPMLD